MTNEALTQQGGLAIPVLEQFTTILIQTIDVDTSAEALPASILANRKAITVQNKSTTAKIYIGSSNAVTAHSDNTTTGGYMIGPNDSVYMSIDGSVALWVISDTLNTGVAIIEFS